MKISRHHNTVLIPVWGFCLFVLLYLVAAAYYPGGSEVDRTAAGFSWMHNYWCDLLEDTAENGAPNRAKPIAIAAMAVLCISIALFFYFVPRLFELQSRFKQSIRVAGILSMCILVFLKADHHDTIINASVALGVLAIILTLLGLLRGALYTLSGMGILCLVMAFLNTYIYYSKRWIDVLPVVQKISFFLFLLWFCLVSFKVYQRTRPIK